MAARLYEYAAGVPVTARPGLRGATLRVRGRQCWNPLAYRRAACPPRRAPPLTCCWPDRWRWSAPTWHVEAANGGTPGLFSRLPALRDRSSRNASLERRPRSEPKLTATEHRLFFVMSFFGNFLFSLCMLYGISMTTATAAGVILATLPAVVALLSWLLLREHLTPRVILAVVLAVGGIALLQLARPAEASSRGAAWLGNLLLFGAVLCEATYVIVAKRLAATRAPLRVSAMVNLRGLALITPFGLWQLDKVDLAAVAGSIWLLLCSIRSPRAFLPCGCGLRDLNRCRRTRRASSQSRCRSQRLRSAHSLWASHSPRFTPSR